MNFVPTPADLGIAYGLSEVALSIFKRAKSSATPADQGSIRLLWTVIALSITAALLAKIYVPQARVQTLYDLRPWFAALCIAGIALRWWSIVHLGKFFTVNVAIAKDHRVIDDGPYRFVRHPSYTGALVSFLAYGLSTGNWLSTVVIIVPITAAFLRRMTIEEEALTSALGGAYREYSGRTKRLIPFVY